MRGHDPETRSLATLALAWNQPVLLLPGCRESPAQRTVARQHLAIVLFLVREVERLLGADRIEPRLDPVTVEPAVELVEAAHEGAPMPLDRLRIFVHEVELRQHESPARFAVFRLHRGDAPKACDRLFALPEFVV